MYPNADEQGFVYLYPFNVNQQFILTLYDIGLVNGIEFQAVLGEGEIESDVSYEYILQYSNGDQWGDSIFNASSTLLDGIHFFNENPDDDVGQLVVRVIDNNTGGVFYRTIIFDRKEYQQLYLKQYSLRKMVLQFERRDK